MNSSMGEHWDSLVKLIIEMSRKDPTNPNLKELNDTVFQTVDNVKNCERIKVHCDGVQP